MLVKHEESPLTCQLEKGNRDLDFGLCVQTFGVSHGDIGGVRVTRLSQFIQIALFGLCLAQPVAAQTAAPAGPIRLLFVGEDGPAPATDGASISVLSMPGLPQAEAAKGEMLATLLRSNPVSTFIAAPENLGGSTGQLFLLTELSLTKGAPAADGAVQPGSGHGVTIGAETMPLDLFAARLDALIDAFAPEHRQVAFFRVRDPDNIFAATVADFQQSLSAAGFAMVVITVGDVPDTCNAAVAPHYALLAGVADRVPFGDANGISTAAEAESWLSRTLARPGQRDPACAGTYSLIIRSNADAMQPVAYHDTSAVLPELETRLYMESFEAMFLLESDDSAKIGTYLQSCVYCPNEKPLTDKLRVMREVEMTRSLEASIWDEIKTDTRTDRLAVYLANCSLCAFRPEAEALMADLTAKAAAREAENAAFVQASASRDLAALRSYATDCVACDHRSDAEAMVAAIEADAAYQAENAALAAALQARDRAALEAWLATCVTCDGRTGAEAAVAEITQAETLIGPCERAAGLPAKGGPRQLTDIDIPAARQACGAALAELPQNPLLQVLAGRIDQAEGDFAKAAAAYENGVVANVPEAFGLAAYMRFAPPDGSAADFEAAVTLARGGAALGDWLSKEILMLAYSRELVAGNGPADALALARENAAEGNVAGQFFLGYFLLSGIGTSVDEAEAAVWLSRATDAGYARAKPFLSEIIERGQAVAASPEAAARLLWEALNDGDAIALARLTDQLSERSPEVIRIIQQNLRDVGIYSGRADGLPGPGTARAVQAYVQSLEQAG